MGADRPYLESGTGWHWLIPAAEMAGLARSNWRPSSDPALARWACLPRIATRALGADPGSVRAARDFTVAILHRWGMAERSPGIAIVVSELMTNALRHAMPGSGDTGPGGRSSSACSSPAPACYARSPTRARQLRHRKGMAPSTRPAADCNSSARSPTSGATPRPARPERSCGPCSARGQHRQPRPGTPAGQAATGPGTSRLGRTSRCELSVPADRGTNIGSWPVTLIQRSRVDNHLMPVRSRSLRDLPGSQHESPRICAGNWPVVPEEALQAYLLASRRHPG